MWAEQASIQPVDPVDYWVKHVSDPDPDVRGHALDALMNLQTPERVLLESIQPALSDVDPRVRAAALFALSFGCRDHTSVRPALLEALRDQDPHVRAVAASCTGDLRLSGSNMLSALSSALADPDLRVREAAGRSLGRIGEAATPYLVEALSAGRYEVRLEVARVCCALGVRAREAVPALKRAIQDSDPVLRETVARAIVYAEAADEDVARAIATRLQDSDPAERADAASLLSRCGDSARVAVESLHALAKDPDGTVRRHCLVALGNLDGLNPEETEGVIDLLRDPELGVQEEAARIIEELGPRGEFAIPVLVGLIESGTWPASRAFGLLEGMGEPAIPELLRLASHGNPRVASHGIRAIVRLAPAREEIPRLLEDSLHSPSSEVLEEAVRSFARVSDWGTERLLSLVDDPDPTVRATAAEALGDVESAAAPVLEALRRGTEDEVSYVRHEAIRSLGQKKTGPAMSALADLLESPFADVRADAIAALVYACFSEPTGPDDLVGIHDGPSFKLHLPSAARVASLIRPALDDEAPFVRRAAVRAFDTVGGDGDDVLSDLLRRLRDEDAVVRFRAARALGDRWTRGWRAIPALFAAIEDPDPGVAEEALEALVTHGVSSEPAMRMALSHPDDGVRRRAQEVLDRIRSSE